jgi:hypothetical protein
MANHENMQNGKVKIHVTCIWETKVLFFRRGVDYDDELFRSFSEVLLVKTLKSG